MFRLGSIYIYGQYIELLLHVIFVFTELLASTEYPCKVSSFSAQQTNHIRGQQVATDVFGIHIHWI